MWSFLSSSNDKNDDQSNNSNGNNNNNNILIEMSIRLIDLLRNDSTSKNSTSKNSTAKDSTVKDSTAKDSTVKDSTASSNDKNSLTTLFPVALLQRDRYSLLDALLMSGLLISGSMICWKGCKRYKSCLDLPSHLLRSKNNTVIHGLAVTVNDSDNLRLFHTPWLLRMMPLFMLKRTFLSKYYNSQNGKTKKGESGQGNGNALLSNSQPLSQVTLNVRLAGVDAPECPAFGGQGQPYSQEAMQWLRRNVQGKRVVVLPHRLDQYQRIVASVWVYKWFGLWPVNLSMEMVRAGYAVVYEGANAEYGPPGDSNMYQKLKQAEQKARDKRLGMWKQLALGTSDDSFVSPAEYKKNLRMQR